MYTAAFPDKKSMQCQSSWFATSFTPLFQTTRNFCFDKALKLKLEITPGQTIAELLFLYYCSTWKPWSQTETLLCWASINKDCFILTL